MKTTNFNPDLPFNVATGLTSGTSSTPGGSLVVDDGTPITGVTTIEVPPGGVTNNGGGSVTLEYELRIEGGQDKVNARGTLGATETIDPTLGNIFTGTLDQNCTLTISAPVGSGGSTLEGWITQNGTGGWTATFAATGGTVTDDGTITPSTTAGVTVRYLFERVPGTTNDWIRNLIGGSGSGAPTTADYLVGTANGSLSAEIVVGTSPGGELGGTWASPTIDTTHSGSAHTDFIAKAIVDAKGDLIAATAADTVARVAVGTNGYLLKADSTATAGVSWVNPNASGRWEVVMVSGSSPPDPVLNSAGDDWVYGFIP